MKVRSPNPLADVWTETAERTIRTIFHPHQTLDGSLALTSCLCSCPYNGSTISEQIPSCDFLLLLATTPRLPNIFLVRRNSASPLRYRRQQRILRTCSLCSFVIFPELSCAESLPFLAHPSITQAVINLRAELYYVFSSPWIDSLIRAPSQSVFAQVAAYAPSSNTDSYNSIRVNNPVFFVHQLMVSRVSLEYRCFEG